MVTTTPATGYIRVSTEEQATGGHSLAAQRERIAAYCQARGYELVAVEADEGVSGKAAANRPGLSAAIASACKTKGILVVASLDRLARHTRECIEISERLEKCGADLAMIDQQIDTKDPLGEFVFGLLAGLAQLERKQIAKRTSNALRSMQAKGIAAGGVPPYGFRKQGKGIVRHDPEMNAVRTIFSLSDGRMSPATIATTLNRRGEPCRGARWYGPAVAAILKRGRVFYGLDPSMG